MTIKSDLEMLHHTISGSSNSYQKNVSSCKPQLKSYPKGAYVYLQKDQSKAVYIIEKGKVKIVNLNDSGKEILKNIFVNGDIFGAIGFLPEGENNEYAISFSSNTIIYKYSTEQFQYLLKNNAEFATQVYEKITLRLKRMEKRVQLLCLKDARKRLAQFLLDYCHSSGLAVNAHIEIDNDLTHKDIADLICASRQTVTSLLNEWKKNNLLSFERNKLIIWNKQGVEQLKESI